MRLYEKVSEHVLLSGNGKPSFSISILKDKNGMLHLKQTLVIETA